SEHFAVAKRISNKQPIELKFIHHILFGRLEKATNIITLYDILLRTHDADLDIPIK
ncbi:hypothetical protein ACJX0J_012202, partial [Zea mays]